MPGNVNILFPIAAMISGKWLARGFATFSPPTCVIIEIESTKESTTEKAAGGEDGEGRSYTCEESGRNQSGGCC